MGDELRIIVKGDFSKLESDLKKLTNQVVDVKVNTSGANTGKKQIDDLTESTKKLDSAAVNALTKFAEWYIIGNIVSNVGRAITGMYEHVASLDESLTTMSFTFNATRDQLEGMVDASEDFARQLGSTTTEVMEAVKIYTNLNATMDEILQKSKAAVVLSNLGGDAIGIDKAAEAIQSLSAQFKLADDEGMKVADVFTYISGNLAMDFSQGINEMSSGVKASGSVAKEAGFSYEQFLAIMGKTMEFSRQSGSQVSNAMKTIFSRIQRVTELTDEEISKVEGAYQSVGISIRKSETEFNSMADTIGQLAQKWGTLTDTEKSYIAEMSAGVRQKSIFLSMMETYTGAMDLATGATNANGYAMKQNEKFVESLQGRLQAFQQAYQELARDIVDSDFLKGVVDGGTKLIDFLGDIQGSVGLVNAAIWVLVPAFMALNGQMVATQAIKIGSFFSNLTSSLAAASAGTATLSTTLMAFNPIMLGLGATLAIIGGIAVKSAADQKAFDDSIKGLGDSIKSASEEASNVEKLVNEFEYLGQKLYKTSAETEKYKQVQAELQKVMPDSTYLIDEQNMSLDAQVEVYDRLARQKYSQKLEEAQVLLATGKKRYDEYNEALAFNKEKIDKLNETITPLLDKQSRGIELTREEQRELQSAAEFRQIANGYIQEAEEYINSFVSAQEVQNEAQKKHESIVHQSVNKIMTAYDIEMQKLESTQAYDVEDKKVKMQNQIALTNKTIDEVKKRIVAYMREQQAMATAMKSIKAMTDTANLTKSLNDQLFPDKKSDLELFNFDYGSMIKGYQDAKGEFSSILADLESDKQKFNEGISGLGTAGGYTPVASDKDKKKKGKKDKEAKPYLDELQKIAEIQHEINTLEAFQSRTDDKEKKIKLIEGEVTQQQNLMKAYHELNNARRKDLANLKEGSEKYNALKNDINSTSEAYEKAKNEVYNLRKAIDELNKKEIEDNIKAFQKQAKEVEDASKELEKSTKDVLDAVEKEAKKSYKKEMDRLKDKKKAELESLKSKREARLKELKKEQEDAEKSYQVQIDAIDKQLDKIKEVNEAYDEEIKRKELLKALQEAENRLSFALSEKNTRLVTDLGVEYVADPRAVDEAQKAVGTAKENYNRFELETQRNQEIKKLEQQKKALEESKKASNEYYAIETEKAKEFWDTQISETETFWDKKIETTETQYDAFFELLSDRENIQYEALKEAGAKIESLEKEGFLRRIAEAESFVAQYNAKMNELQTIQGQIAELESSLSGERGTSASSSKGSSSRFSDAKKTQKVKASHNPMKSYDVGGYIDKDQIANIHKDEVIMNSDQQSNLIEHMQNGNIPAVGRDMFNLSNIKPSSISNNNSKSETISINTVKIDSVTDLPNFVMQLKQHVQTR